MRIGVELPSDWDVVGLGKLFEIQQGKSLSQKARTGKSSRHFLRTSNVLWGRLDLTKVDEMDFTDDEARRLSLQLGDLLVCEGGDVGRTAIWQGEMDGVSYQNHLHRLRRKDENVIPEFYMYWMQAALLHLGLYAGTANRTTIPNLSKSRLSNFLVPVPSRDEQGSIADILRTVQQTKEATEKVVTAVHEYKRSFMRHLFTYGKASATEAEGVDLRETEIGAVPSSWELARIDDVATVSSGGTPDRSRQEYWGGSIPWIKTGEIKYRVIRKADEYITELGLNQSAARVVKKGAILMAMYGQGVTRGRVAVLGIDAAINQACAAIEPTGAIDSHFLYHWLTYRYEEIRALAHGANQKNLNAGMIRQLGVPLVPIDEQLVIAQALDAVDRKIWAESEPRQALDQMLDSLLAELMTGKRRVVSLEAVHG